MSQSALLDQAFELLALAAKLEEDDGGGDGGGAASGGGNDAAAVTSTRLVEASTKYYEACYLMKRYVNRVPVADGGGCSSSAASKRSSEQQAQTRSLLLDKVTHYEKHAADLLRRAGESEDDDDDDEAETEAGGKGGGRASSSSSGRQRSWNAQRQSSVRNFRDERVASPGEGGVSSFRGGDHRRAGVAGGAVSADAQKAVAAAAGRANGLLAKALDLDERGKGGDEGQAAVEMYMKAAEAYLEGIKKAEDVEKAGGVGGVGGNLTVTSDALKRRLEGALGRIEAIKSGEGGTGTGSGGGGGGAADKQRVRQQPLARSKAAAPRSSAPGSVSGAGKGGGSLSAAEISVLKRSSMIASGLFLPWSDEEARTYDYGGTTPYGKPFVDPDGPLKLSDKQRSRMEKWARPSEIAAMRGCGTTSPVMIKAITPYTIRQRCVTDCSFVASLCIAAAFERKFQRRLITSIVYPQDGAGMPVYNPHGKYMVKLWLNGVARRVVVDDTFPVDRHGNLLCSHTEAIKKVVGANNVGGGGGPLELWVTVIEKAYMKLCGGYDFPGSNSGVDLFSLTGWIPERIFFPEKPEKVRDFETPVQRVWERLYSANSYGDCLITMAMSGNITEEKAKEVGLVTGHAYAMLGCIETSNGIRLLQLKNPWAHQGWKGRYSPHDRASWKDQRLRSEVGYDPAIASTVDDGVFWISWEDVLVYFRNVQMSWNPALFAHTATAHDFWPKEMGPPDDSFNVGDNPQYVLTMSDKAVEKGSSVWMLLSRHVTKQEQEGMEAKDYLTLHIHRNTREKDRVRYPGGKSCVLTGAYTNNCHVLVRYDVSSPLDKHLSLVLSQYEKSNDLGYTLSVYCAHAFKLGRPAKELPVCAVVNSEWTEMSAGGPVGQPGFRSNPMWSVAVPGEGAFVQVRCSSVKTFAINVLLVEVDNPGTRVGVLDRKPAIDTGDYRHGFVATNSIWVPGGLQYTLVVSTFHRGQVGGFRAELKSTAKLNPISIAW